MQPIIKVIARGLTESEAFLIEKTLIWKLGKTLTNISSGQFFDKFRPHDSFHLNLNGFDFENEEMKENSIKRMKENVKRLMDYIDNDGFKK